MDLGERLRRASGTAEEVGTVLHDSSEEVLLALLDNPRLSEEHLRMLLSRKNLSRNFLRELGSRERLLRPYQVKLALLRNPRAPRGVSLTLLRHVYLFDLAKVATTPSAAPDLRRAAEEAIVARLPALSLGERLSLARQGASQIAAALLADSDTRVFCSALANPRLTEAGVVKTLGAGKLAPEALEAIAEHPAWAARYDVRLALIRHPGTSLRRMLSLLDRVRWQDLADLPSDRRMPADRRHYVAELVRRRRGTGILASARVSKG